MEDRSIRVGGRSWRLFLRLTSLPDKSGYPSRTVDDGDDDLDRRRLGVTPPVHRTGRDGAPTCPEGENPAELYTTVSGGDGAQATRSWITRVSPHDLFEGKHIVREGRGNP